MQIDRILIESLIGNGIEVDVCGLGSIGFRSELVPETQEWIMRHPDTSLVVYIDPITEESHIG